MPPSDQKLQRLSLFLHWVALEPLESSRCFLPRTIRTSRGRIDNSFFGTFLILRDTTRFNGITRLRNLENKTSELETFWKLKIKACLQVEFLFCNQTNVNKSKYVYTT